MRTLIVSANLALMLSAVFAPFLGAIAMVFGWVSWVVVEGRLGRLAAEVEGEQEFSRRSVCERESSCECAEVQASGPVTLTLN